MLPVALAVMVPLVAVGDAAAVVVPVSTMLGQAVAVTTKDCVPVQLLPSFAVMVYDPAARFTKLPLD